MKYEKFEEYLSTSDSKAVKVLLHLLKIKNDDGVFYCTLDKVAEDCEVTKVTVNKVFQRLYAEEFLVKVNNGVYRLVEI